MQRVHVGSAIERGALGIFPVWGEVAVERDYGTAIADAHVGERDSPDVAALMVANTSELPLLLLEGQLLEGGWQNRMVSRSVIVAPNDQLAVDVVCVEQGRWQGQRPHTHSRRHAATRVRAGLRTHGDQQGEVWMRIAQYESRYGCNPTSSLTAHVDRAAADIAPMTRGMRPFPGQIGIIIAISGHPVSAELFDSPLTLVEQFDSIVAAAAMDSCGRPADVTPSRRARRFDAHAANVHLGNHAPAGAGITLVGETPNASVRLLHWQDRAVHTSLLNPRHELVRTGHSDGTDHLRCGGGSQSEP